MNGQLEKADKPPVAQSDHEFVRGIGLDRGERVTVGVGEGIFGALPHRTQRIVGQHLDETRQIRGRGRSEDQSVHGLKRGPSDVAVSR